MRHSACTVSPSQLPQVVRPWGVLTNFTSKCASHHGCVCVFVISTSKGAPRMKCLNQFYFQMCLAPQLRQLFRHLDFQKCSENDVFWPFWLPKLLRARTACDFWSLLPPNGSAPAAFFGFPEPLLYRSWDGEKVHAVVARSTFQSKMLKTCGFCSKRKHDGRLEGSAKMHFAWQARYKRHLQQTCPEVSLEGLHFGAVCQDDFEWQMQHFVWPGLTFSWQPQRDGSRNLQIAL